MLAILTRLNCVMVRALTAWAIPALFTFAVYIPVSAVTAQLALAGAGANAWVLPISAFDPVTGFTVSLKNARSAALAVNEVIDIGLFQ
jgi:hypothetical protein